MKQDSGKILPLFINTDKGFEDLKPEEAAFIKGLSWDINANPGGEIGTSNPSGEGQNLVVLTPIRSNVKLTGIELPSGYNKNCGTFESRLTKELYYFNYNGNGFHGIYVIDGDTGGTSKVVVDPELSFSETQEAVTTNRVLLRYVKDSLGEIREKHLMWTDGKKWQGWVNVVAAINTDGFNVSIYPYWALTPPHFDRRELLEWPVRKPMYKPQISIIQNTVADAGKNNLIADKNFRFAYDFINTDGRYSDLSPYSLPLQVKTEEYTNNIENLPRKAAIKLAAGSPLTEKIRIYVQRADGNNSIDPTAVYGDWLLYDTIEKFDTKPSGNYWERKNPWSAFSYDPVMNTIQYEFDNSKVGKQISQKDALRLQTGMPQISQAATDLDDAVILCNNRYNYNNLSKSIIDKLSAEVVEKDQTSCSLQMRTIYLYAYAGNPSPTRNWCWTSQVGYTYGDDKQVRFGGLRMSITGNAADVDLNESKFFGLDFANKESFRVYLKGTPYYADGEWYIVNTDNTLEAIGKIYDFNNNDDRVEAQNVFKSGGYFICRFKLVVPAGRYIATIGRHNVSSASDWRGKSTYIYGIANSRAKSVTAVDGFNQIVSLKNTAIRTYSKEMEIDCTAGNVDVWGQSNNEDVFYIYSPGYDSLSNGNKFRFIEGYFKESRGSDVPVEMFPYFSNRNNFDDWGKFTDKNGFYWGFTRASDTNSTDVQFRAIVNCNNRVFVIPTSSTGSGWKKNADAYLETQNGGQVGDCNRVVFTGKITDLTGTIAYSNIAISMKDGQTVYTRPDGTFIMYVHNGNSTPRTSPVYVNASGNFLITLRDCTPLPISSYSESLIPCIDCNVRNYPLQLNLNILIPNNKETSVKEDGRYTIGCVVADLAGRMTFVNPFQDISVESFLQRRNTKATYFRMLINSALDFMSENPDFKWFAPYVSKNTALKKYNQWVGDSVVYLDNDGSVVDDPATASFVKIIIQSLYDANVRNNFSLLSSYQFVKGDRLRVLNDGDGNLLTTAIDVQILGTNYNQAAINAGIIPGTIVSDNSSTDIGLILRYDQRLDILSEKTGFWIEIYTPVQENDVIPFFEIGGFYPIINGKISVFTGYNNGVPAYTNLNSIDLDFWDTYFLQRSILGKYYNHPFESENVTDNWGKNITSGGRINVENKEAAQKWFGGDVVRSDSFVHINGLASFREENRKDYGIYPYGEIVSAHTRRNIVAFICNNDWFVAEFNMPYTRVQDGQLVVTNLDENLSLPKPKGGPEFGIEKDDLETLIVDDDYFFWYDRKNSGYIKCNYSSAMDISQEQGDEKGGVQSYLNAKTTFINNWNDSKADKDKFDVVAGIDSERGNIYLTFRPRRNRSNEADCFVNQRRNFELKSHETIQYSIQHKGWIPCPNFTPESYARLRGKWANLEMFTFAAGVPYYHNGSPNDSFLNFYGKQCEPVVIVAMNKEEYVKIFQSISYDCHGSELFVDFVFDEQTNSFSYIPSSQWKEREHIFYAPFMRDMVSYPPTDPEEIYRSMLLDGKRIFGSYCVVRFVQKYSELGKYFQLSGIEYLFTNSHPNKP